MLRSSQQISKNQHIPSRLFAGDNDNSDSDPKMSLITQDSSLPSAAPADVAQPTSFTTEEELRQTTLPLSSATYSSTIQGILYKRRDVFQKQWPPRYFVLSPSTGLLSYYILPKSVNLAAPLREEDEASVIRRFGLPRGTIYLPGCHVYENHELTSILQQRLRGRRGSNAVGATNGATPSNSNVNAKRSGVKNGQQEQQQQYTYVLTIATLSSVAGMEQTTATTPTRRNTDSSLPVSSRKEDSKESSSLSKIPAQQQCNEEATHTTSQRKKGRISAPRRSYSNAIPASSSHSNVTAPEEFTSSQYPAISAVGIPCQHLAARTEEERTRWVEALNAVCRSLDSSKSDSGRGCGHAVNSDDFLFSPAFDRASESVRAQNEGLATPLINRCISGALRESERDEDITKDDETERSGDIAHYKQMNQTSQYTVQYTSPSLLNDDTPSWYKNVPKDICAATEQKVEQLLSLGGHWPVSSEGVIREDSFLKMSSTDTSGWKTVIRNSVVTAQMKPCDENEKLFTLRSDVRVSRVVTVGQIVNCLLDGKKWK